MLYCTAVRSRAKAPRSPLRLACSARARTVGVLCYSSVRTRARARASRSSLRLACCARARTVGVLCCTAVRARAKAPPFSTALGLLSAWACCGRVALHCSQIQSKSQRPRSLLRLACCARGYAVGVLCCVLYRFVVGALRFVIFCMWVRCAVSQSGLPNQRSLLVPASYTTRTVCGGGGRGFVCCSWGRCP